MSKSGAELEMAIGMVKFVVVSGFACTLEICCLFIVMDIQSYLWGVDHSLYKWTPVVDMRFRDVDCQLRP